MPIARPSSKVTTVEQNASMKADAEQVQQVNNAVNGIQCKISGFEQSLQQKVSQPIGQIAQGNERWYVCGQHQLSLTVTRLQKSHC